MQTEQQPSDAADRYANTASQLPQGFAVACIVSTAVYLACSDGLHEYVRFLLVSAVKVLARLS